jgi:Domain of Unknown Function (DUF350)
LIEFDLPSLAAGIVAYGVAILLAVLLVFVTFRANAMLLASKRKEEAMLLAGHRSLALALGATLLSQAILLRHAVFPTMAVLRDLFLAKISAAAVFWTLGQCLLFFVVISAASFGSVQLAAWLFTRMTGGIEENEEILQDNLAVAIFYAFVLFAITAILNEGMEDLSRSLIPYGGTGVVRVP